MNGMPGRALTLPMVSFATCLKLSALNPQSVELTKDNTAVGVIEISLGMKGGPLGRGGST